MGGMQQSMIGGMQQNMIGGMQQSMIGGKCSRAGRENVCALAMGEKVPQEDLAGWPPGSL
eukprot:366327-Chlamydomonas_euryale.AAC.4